MRSAIRWFGIAYGVTFAALIVLTMQMTDLGIEHKSTTSAPRARSRTMSAVDSIESGRMEDKLMGKIHATEAMMDFVAGLMILGVPIAATVLLIQFWVSRDKPGDG